MEHNHGRCHHMHSGPDYQRYFGGRPREERIWTYYYDYIEKNKTNITLIIEFLYCGEWKPTLYLNDDALIVQLSDSSILLVGKNFILRHILRKLGFGQKS